MDYLPRPLLQTIVHTAVDGTAASAGWLIAPVDDELAIVAAAAADPALVDRVLWQRGAAGSGVAGMVLQSGQPVALAPVPGSSPDAWTAGLLGREPTALLCVPAFDDEQLEGALVLLDRAGGGPFDFDDVELATLLAQVAGAALAEGAGSVTRVPGPDQLAGELTRLSGADPTRYAAVAQAVGALLSQA